MKRFHLAALTIAVGLLVSCATPPRGSTATPETNAASHIQAIPAANPEKYSHLHDMRAWQNPYLIVRADGVGVLDAANHEQRLIKPEELPQTLAQMPASAWPYGRVVAVAENGVTGSEDDRVQIRKNRALVAGTLEALQVAINWVPST